MQPFPRAVINALHFAELNICYSLLLVFKGIYHYTGPMFVQETSANGGCCEWFSLHYAAAADAPPPPPVLPLRLLLLCFRRRLPSKPSFTTASAGMHLVALDSRADGYSHVKVPFLGVSFFFQSILPWVGSVSTCFLREPF